MPTNNIDLRFTVVNAARVVIQRAAVQAELFRLTQPPLKRKYFENAAICGNCNGDGMTDRTSYCRACDGYGIMPWHEFKRIRYDGDPIWLGVFYTACVRTLKDNHNSHSVPVTICGRVNI